MTNPVKDKTIPVLVVGVDEIPTKYTGWVLTELHSQCIYTHYINGMASCKTGPARITVSNSGEILREEYLFDNCTVSFEDFLYETTCSELSSMPNFQLLNGFTPGFKIAGHYISKKNFDQFFKFYSIVGPEKFRSSKFLSINSDDEVPRNFSGITVMADSGCEEVVFQPYENGNKSCNSHFQKIGDQFFTMINSLFCYKDYNTTTIRLPFVDDLFAALGEIKKNPIGISTRYDKEMESFNIRLAYDREDMFQDYNSFTVFGDGSIKKEHIFDGKPIRDNVVPHLRKLVEQYPEHNFFYDNKKGVNCDMVIVSVPNNEKIEELDYSVLNHRGELHSTKGPALYNATIKKESYYVNGIRRSKEDWSRLSSIINKYDEIEASKNYFKSFDELLESKDATGYVLQENNFVYYRNGELSCEGVWPTVIAKKGIYLEHEHVYNGIDPKFHKEINDYRNLLLHGQHDNFVLNLSKGVLGFFDSENADSIRDEFNKYKFEFTFAGYAPQNIEEGTVYVTLGVNGVIIWTFALFGQRYQFVTQQNRNLHIGGDKFEMYEIDGRNRYLNINRKTFIEKVLKDKESSLLPKQKVKPAKFENVLNPCGEVYPRSIAEEAKAYFTLNKPLEYVTAEVCFEKPKEAPKEMTVVEKRKQENKEIVKRGLVKRIKTMLTTAMVDLLSNDLADKTNAKKMVKKMISGPFGGGLVSVTLGSAIQLVSKQISEEYSEYLNLAAKELRVSGGADVVYEFSNVAFDGIASEIKQQFDKIKVHDSARVRVDVKDSKPNLVQDDSVELTANQAKLTA